MTFSFANYKNPNWMRFGPIRVIVENNIQPYKGFQSHPHENMEILTYVSSGTLTHGDNMGYTEAIQAGEMQRLTAGTGIVHSEENKHDEVEHNIQIWILPNKAGLEPGYKMKRFTREERTDQLRLYVSQDGQEKSVSINQDADIYAGILSQGTSVAHQLGKNRGAWIQVVYGRLTVNDQLELHPGDGVGIEDVKELELSATEETEFILFDVAMNFETPYNLA